MAFDVLADASVEYHGVGGSAGNVVSILAYLGWQAVPVARLGRDPAGELIRREFESLGIPTTFVRTEPAAHTPVVYQWVASGQPHYSLSCPVCGHKGTTPESHWEDLAEDVRSSAPRASVFYFDRPTALNCELARHFRSDGALVVFEPSKAAATKLFEECARLSHVVKYSADRVERVGVEGDFLEVRTMSSEGLAFRMPGDERWTHLRSIAAPVVADSSGSGDWCTAGSLYWFVKQTQFSSPTYAQVRSALRFGQALAALNCMYEGARMLARAVPRSQLIELALRLSSGEAGATDELASMPWCAGRNAPRHATAPTITPALLCCQQLAS